MTKRSLDDDELWNNGEECELVPARFVYRGPPPTPEEQLHTRLAKVSKCRQRVVAELASLRKLLDKYPQLEDQLFSSAGPQLVVDNSKRQVPRFRPSKPDGGPKAA